MAESATVLNMVPLLNVRDIRRTAEFYRKALGFRITARASDEKKKLVWARMRCGQFEMMLNARTTGSGLAKPRDHVGVVLYMNVADVDALQRRLERKGLRVGKVSQEEYGARQCSLHDPDNYEVALISPTKP